MPANEEEISKGLHQLMNMRPQCFVGTITKLEEKDVPTWAHVKPLTGPEIFECRFKAAIDDLNDGIIQIPEVGSTVLCLMINNNKSDVTIVKTSAVTKIVINGGELGGLVIHQKVMDNLDQIKSYIADLKSAVANGLKAVGDGDIALGTIASQAFEAELSGKQIELDNMENDKVVH